MNIALSNGDGTFHFAATLNSGNVFFFSPSLAVGDFNSDGKLDLVEGDAGNNSSQVVFLGKGDGAFQTPVSYPISGKVTAGDFNGDGITDLAIAGSSGNTVDILQGSGDGTFHLVLSYTTTATPLALAVADFNGDGRVDIVTANLFSNGFPPGGTLTILLGVPAGVSLNATGGTPQSALSGTPFNVPLQVTVVQNGSPVNGAIVTFTVPSSGASALLSPPATAITNTAGIASVIATGNGAAGSYIVTASYQGLTATFTLTNTTVASITASSGTPQFALVNTPFLKPLEVTVRDSAGNLASGATVTFIAPTGGAGLAFFPGTAVTNAAGQASVPAFASNTPGSYTVTARVGTLSAAFSLTNTQIASVTTTRGTPQFTPVGTAFPIPLEVTVKDSAGRPANNVPVSFVAPSSGASAVSNFVSFTNIAGVASTMATANNILGGYTVTASLLNSNTTLSASFSLTNLAAGTVAPVNLAIGKTATQSSTLSGYPTAVPASALDGSTDGNFFHGSVTHTNPETNPWWQVDLGSSATVNSIVIWNRTDCCGTRLNDYWVFVSDTPFGATDTPATLQGRLVLGLFGSHQFAAPNPSTTITVGVIGRYVRVQLTGAESLSLAEVQVIGTPGSSSSTNLALGKTASQSSTFAGTAVPGRAVDGNTDGNFSHNSVTHTNQEFDPWWQVDLGSSATVNSIVIWNRTDCCANRLSNYWVFVSNTPFNSFDNNFTLVNRPGTFSMFQPSSATSARTISVGGYQGRFVRVQLATVDYLSLAEVQVFGTPGAPAPPNLALGKPAAQSSTLSISTAVAGSAVDGNTDGNFFSGSVTHTNLDINPWWQVDLGASAAIDSIVIWNRSDACCIGRLANNLWIFVSDTPFSPADTPATLSIRTGTFSQQPGLFGTPTTITIPGAQGRYVRVQLAGANYLSLAEVQVFGTPVNSSGSNLAQGKAATQSSALSGSAGSAVDGSTDGNFFNGSVTHTNLETNAWWQVDLGASSAISSIVIWNRTDCCSARLNDYWVFVSDTPFSPSDTPSTLQNRPGTFSSHQTTAPSPSATIPAFTQGRYVRVQLNGANYLSLAEVQVIGQ